MGVPNGEWSMDKIVYQNHFALESFKTQMTVFNEFCKKYESLEPNVFSKANMLHDEIANALRWYVHTLSTADEKKGALRHSCANELLMNLHVCARFHSRFCG